MTLRNVVTLHTGAVRCALGLALGLPGVLLGCAREARPPSVVLVVVDTLRADHLGCYGYGRDTSPRLDALAAEGARYDRALSQAPWTTPSMASLLTSQYPSAVGIGSERSVLADELVLLPEVLAAAGYRTGAVVSHTFCSSRWNFDQGFDWFDQSNVGGHAVVTSEGVTARALEFVDWAGEAPFFLWAHYFDPHFHYFEHPGHRFEADADYDGPIEPGLQYSELFAMRFELSPQDVAELVRIYDSEVAFTDAWIGSLLDGLRERGRYEDTLIVVTGDHGEEFRDHGDLGHARQLYQELVNVPLIVKPARGPGRPGPPAGTVVESPVALLDVLPTVLETAGLPPPSGIDGGIQGRSLFAPPVRGRAIVSETSRQGGVRSVTQDDYKLIQYLSDGRAELYRVSEDRLEREDLAEALPDERARLEELLAAWEDETRARLSRELELSPADLEHLRALGYAGADE